MSDIPTDNYSLRLRRNLPPEIITDILSRLPVKSLYRFKCVSPSWNSLISSPFFARTHFNRTKTSNPKQFAHNILLISTDLYSFNLTADVLTATKLHLPSLQPPENKWVYALGSCHGLLLFCHVCRSKFFLLNPSTRECKELPHVPFVNDPGHGMYTCLYGVGYDSSTDDYKVVMLFYFPKPSDSDESENESSSNLIDSTTVVVYSLKANAWRRIQDTQRILEGTIVGVYFNGRLHWVYGRAGSFVILAFDLADEIFREVLLPVRFASLVDDEITNYEMVIVGDSLCLVYELSSSQIEVWEMKESGDRVKWSKTMIEIMTDVNETRLLSLLGLLAANEFVLITEVKRAGVPVYKLVVYNPQTGMLRDIVVGGIPNQFGFGGTYVESFLPCLY